VTKSRGICRYHPFETKCSGCDALIVWFRTKAGKRAQVNLWSRDSEGRSESIEARGEVSK
jgi:hypothetical protein